MFDRIRSIFHFSGRDRKSVFALLALILLCGGANRAYRLWADRQAADALDVLSAERRRLLSDYRSFVDSIRRQEASSPDFSYDAVSRRSRPSSRSSFVENLHPMPFNPNTADSLTFRRLGLPDWMARNILRYREKGGKFRRPEDFQKIYGLTQAQYEALAPHIIIEPEDTARRLSSVPVLYMASVAADSVESPSSALPKYPAGTVIELNCADTAQLKRIPGIGSGIARMIVNYRQRLGGFYDLKQLEEIHINYRLLTEWFSVDPQAIRRINLNRVSVDRLRRHPYFNFYQAKAIVEYRRQEGELHSLKIFSLLDEFSPADLERMAPYVCFE